jgi:hypothetical protein
MREMRNVYKILVEKPEGKKPLERLRRRFKDDNKLDKVR